MGTLNDFDSLNFEIEYSERVVSKFDYRDLEHVAPVLSEGGSGESTSDGEYTTDIGDSGNDN